MARLEAMVKVYWCSGIPLEIKDGWYMPEDVGRSEVSLTPEGAVEDAISLRASFIERSKREIDKAAREIAELHGLLPSLTKEQEAEEAGRRG